MRALIPFLAALTAACNGGLDLTLPSLSSTPAPPQARIAPDVVLSLPLPPGYPETVTTTQIVRSRYAGVDVAVEAVLALSPEEVVIVLTVLGGPRLATITWDGSGVRIERAPYAPTGAPAENIVADIFLATWPAELVRSALPTDIAMTVDENGARVLRRGEEVIMEIAPDAEAPNRVVVGNRALGYEVIIIHPQA